MLTTPSPTWTSWIEWTYDVTYTDDDGEIQVATLLASAGYDIGPDNLSEQAGVAWGNIVYKASPVYINGKYVMPGAILSVGDLVETRLTCNIVPES